MRYQIENLEDIGDSKSFMKAYLSSCSYKSLKYMMYFIILILISITVWSVYAEKEVVVSAYGEIDVSHGICNVYIENTQIGCIRKDNDVQLNIVSLSSYQYGAIKSKLDDVSDDVIIDEGTGKKYYKATCKLTTDFLTDKKGNQVDLKNGMVAQVRIITYKTTYFHYVLEQIL